MNIIQWGGFVVLGRNGYVTDDKRRAASRAAQDVNMNETLERVFKNIEESAISTNSEDDLKGLFDDLDVNSSKLGNTVAKHREEHGGDGEDKEIRANNTRAFVETTFRAPRAVALFFSLNFSYRNAFLFRISTDRQRLC